MNGAGPDSTIVRAIKEIVERETARFGLESLDVEVANDNDGDSVLRIAATYGAKGEAVDVGTLDTVASHVRERLLEMGEDRFPHIRYQFPEDRKVTGQIGR